jgi:hypothetical protein
MRRLTITLSAVALVLSIAPAAALARHHHPRHHRRVVHHARIMRLGSDTPTSSGTTANTVTVQSFQNGLLTLTVGNSTVSGTVTDATEIECAAPEQDQVVHEDGDGGGSGSDNGSGDDGDQSSGEQGDDDAASNCSTMNLTGGAVVREAELRITSAGAVFDKVELAS